MDLGWWRRVRWADTLLGDEDRAAAIGRRPSAGVGTPEVRQVVGDHLDALLARWDTEPPAIRIVQACLAAMYPQTGRYVLGKIKEMRAEYGGTQAGAYVDLAAALLSDNGERALVLASDIADWDGRSPDLVWPYAPGVDAAVIAGHALAQGVVDIGGS